MNVCVYVCVLLMETLVLFHCMTILVYLFILWLVDLWVVSTFWLL